MPLQTPMHHPGEDLLLSYSAGALSEGWGLAIATHLALCPECRAVTAQAEQMGGALLDDLPPQSMTDGALDAVLAQLDQPGSVAAVPRAPDEHPDTLIFPAPLRDYVGSDPEAIAWKKIGSTGFQHVIMTNEHAQVRLLRIRAGRPVPEHGHRGRELTLVLSGVFADHIGSFARGDLEDADEQLVHQPAAGAGEDCICLAVTDARLRFKGLVPRLAQPFVGV